jgi:DNA adenine methylase
MAGIILRSVKRAAARRDIVPRPFLKWAGGKGQLLPELMARVRSAGHFRQYHEPFVGGGALFFELYRANHLGTAPPFLSHSNENLIDAYMGVKEDVDRIICLLIQHKASHSQEYYYQVRATAPTDPVERAARIIYLNRTCYNGLYRENRKGKFNVPFGRYTNPAICDEENLRAVAEALCKATIETRPFDSVLDRAEPGDFVYFDPPYHPLSKTASFTSYDKNGFDKDAQHRLAAVFRQLSEHSVKVLLSNSMTPFVKDLYRGFRIEKVWATRAVNSRGDRRGKVCEALVRNF